MNDYDFGNHILNLREKKGLTQNDVAISLGISDKAVSKWENGTAKPTIKNLKKLSDILDVSLDELVNVSSKNKVTQINKIVITGGPISGKTMSLKFIKEYFENHGYKVIVVSDIKTIIKKELQSNEVIDYNEYEKSILSFRLQLEDLYEEMINNTDYDKILMIYDGAAIDLKASLGKKNFNIICNNLNINEEELRNSYDAIFHLKTLAKFDEKMYDEINSNKEIDSEYAKVIDDKLMEAWIPHSNYRIIDCFDAFGDKTKILIDEISKFLNEDKNNYVEKKYLIEKPSIEYLDNMKDSSKVRMTLTYLKDSTEDNDIKLLLRKENSRDFYQIIKKGTLGKITNYLTADEYIRLLEDRDISRKQIIKDRYSFVYNSIYYKIDIFQNIDNLSILEIDLLNKHEEVQIPKFIKVIKDVSEDINYKNYNISKKKND